MVRCPALPEIFCQPLDGWWLFEFERRVSFWFLRRGDGHAVLAGRFSNGDLMAFPGFRTIALASLSAVLSAASLAPGQVVYPAKGQSAEQQQADALNAHKQGEEAYFRARAACLEGRGYSVK